MVAMIGVWRRRGLSREELARRLTAESTSWNTHPYLAGLALSTRLRLEDDGDPVLGRRSAEALASVLGGLGDRFFWAGLIPTLVTVALGLLFVAGPWAVLGLWLGFAVGLTWLRRRLTLEGYRRGTRVVELLESPRIEFSLRVLAGLGVILTGVAGAALLTASTELSALGGRSLSMLLVGVAWGSVVAWRRWSLQWWAVGVVLVAWADLALQF